MQTLKPAPSAPRPRDVFVMIHLNGIEAVTRALLNNHEIDLRDLEPLVRRSRAMVEAFDRRMEALK